MSSACWVMACLCMSYGDHCTTVFSSYCWFGFEGRTRLRRWVAGGSLTGVVGEREQKSISRGSRLILPGLWRSSLSGKIKVLRLDTRPAISYSSSSVVIFGLTCWVMFSTGDRSLPSISPKSACLGTA